MAILEAIGTYVAEKAIEGQVEAQNKRVEAQNKCGTWEGMSDFGKVAAITMAGGALYTGYRAWNAQRTNPATGAQERDMESTLAWGAGAAALATGALMSPRLFSR